MAVDEGEGGVVEVEADGDGALVAGLASEASLDLGGADLVDAVFVEVSDVEQDVAANHGFFRHAYILCLLAQRIRDYPFPKQRPLFILALYHRLRI